MMKYQKPKMEIIEIEDVDTTENSLLYKEDDGIGGTGGADFDKL